MVRVPVISIAVFSILFSCQPMLTADDIGRDAEEHAVGGDDGAHPADDGGADADQPADPGGDPGGDPASDSGDPGSDPGPVEPCPPVTFRYDGQGQATTVLVSGTFNEWAASVGEGAWQMLDDDHNGIFELAKELPSGRYFYKFIVDGNWILDPGNPQQQDDGCGNLNSILEIDCDVHLKVVNHARDDVARTISATVELVPAQAVLQASSVSVTLDNQAVAGANVTVSGNRISVALSGVPFGIHDLRLSAAATDGRRAKTILLKFPLGQSGDWRDDLMYFAMLDRFSNGNAGNDDPVPDVDGRTNYAGGDFAGLMQKIEEGYFDALGVSALWITWPGDNLDGYEDGARPNEHRCGMNANNMQTAPMRYTAYHGYWPVKLLETEEHFGTWEELKQLVDAAHAHGIRVLLDFVANHVHMDSALYTEHPKYFNWYGHGSEHICSQVGWDTEPETCWFTSYLPDLNYCNPGAVEYMVQLALAWIVQSGADGFRLDAVKHVNKAFLRRLRERLTNEIELTGVPFYLVGETFTDAAAFIATYLGDDLIHGQFDFPANLKILQALAKNDIGLSQMDADVRAAKATYAGAYSGQVMSSFIGNHDISRFASMAAGDIICGVWDEVSNAAQGWLFPPGNPSNQVAYARLKLAFTYIMAVPGIPLIYYGDEFGMPGAGDPDNRRLMRFGDSLTQAEMDTLEFIQRLGSVRAAHPALRTGSWEAPLVAETDWLVWMRVHPSETALVIINRSSAPRSLELNVPSVPDGTVFSQALSASPLTAAVSGGKLSVSVQPLEAQVWISQ